MEPSHILFYLFAAVTVVSAFRVVTSGNPVHSALFLVLTFVSAAAVWLMLDAEFLAIVLVLVYIGAVMVLFLFVVMMLDVRPEHDRPEFRRSVPVAALVGSLVVIELCVVIWMQFGSVRGSDAPALPPNYSNSAVLGHLMYTEYAYPIQIAGCILLVGMVAAIALTLRRRKDSRHQDVGQQVRVRAGDRLRIVKVQTGRGTGAAPVATTGSPAMAAADTGVGTSPTTTAGVMPDTVTNPGATNVPGAAR